MLWIDTNDRTLSYCYFIIARIVFIMQVLKVHTSIEIMQVLKVHTSIEIIRDFEIAQRNFEIGWQFLNWRTI